MMTEPTAFQRGTARQIARHYQDCRGGLITLELHEAIRMLIEAMQAQAAEDARQRDAARAYAADTLAALGRVIDERERVIDLLVRLRSCVGPDPDYPDGLLGEIREVIDGAGIENVLARRYE